MPSRIVVVHDDSLILKALTAALRGEGHDVSAFDDPILAWDVLRASWNVELLITRIQFAPSKPHGIALAHCARMASRDVKVLFVASPEFRSLTEGIGVLLPTPTDVPRMLRAAAHLLRMEIPSDGRPEERSDRSKTERQSPLGMSQ